MLLQTADYDFAGLSASNPKWQLFAEMLAEDGHDNLPAVGHDLGRLLQGVEFTGKSVLDVGAGRGLMSLLAGLNGAARVVSMEPELPGARHRVLATLTSRVQRLDLPQIEVLQADVNTWDFGDDRFDVVLSFNSVEHIFESSANARRDPMTYLGCQGVAKRFRSVLKDNGVAIVTNAARYGLFYALRRVGIKPPWRRSHLNVNWRIHQNPRVWKQIFLESGFRSVDIIYPVPYRLKALSRLIATPAANFLLLASFGLRGRCG